MVSILCKKRLKEGHAFRYQEWMIPVSELEAIQEMGSMVKSQFREGSTRRLREEAGLQDLLTTPLANGPESLFAAEHNMLRSCARAMADSRQRSALLCSTAAAFAVLQSTGDQRRGGRSSSLRKKEPDVMSCHGRYHDVPF
jgi:hypothetical protein